MRGVRIPDAVRAEARRLYASGVSAAEVARTLGIDRTTVLCWRRTEGWPRQRPYPDRIVQRRYALAGRPYAREIVMAARALWGQEPAYRIAWRLDLDRETVTAWAKRYGWGPGYRTPGGLPRVRRTTAPALPLPQQSEARWRCACERLVVGLVCPSCGTKAAWAA